MKRVVGRQAAISKLRTAFKALRTFHESRRMEIICLRSTEGWKLSIGNRWKDGSLSRTERCVVRPSTQVKKASYDDDELSRVLDVMYVATGGQASLDPTGTMPPVIWKI